MCRLPKYESVMLGWGRSILLHVNNLVKWKWRIMSASTAAGRLSRSPTSPCSSYTNNNTTAVRSQPVRATVQYQLLRGNQLSPTRPASSSSSSSSSSVAGSNTGPTTSRCSSPANPSGSGSDDRLVRRQRLSPPDSSDSPERPHDPPLSKGNDILYSGRSVSVM